MRTQVKNELNNLAHGNVLLPPDADASRALEVVPVHDDVDSQVQGNDGPRDGSVADELGVTEKSGRAMVIGMEEGCAMLARNVD